MRWLAGVIVATAVGASGQSSHDVRADDTVALAENAPVQSTAPATQSSSESSPLDEASVDPKTISTWNATVRAFAQALTTSARPDDVGALMSDAVTVRQFNRSEREDPQRLQSRFAGMKVLAARGYLQTPQTIAGDIAADLKDADVSDVIRRRLTPGDEETLKRANSTAAKWIDTSLLTSGAQPVAVIVLQAIQEPPTTSNANANGDEGDATKSSGGSSLLTFILLKGDVADGRFRISQLRYGDPLPFTSTASSAGE